VLASSVFVTFVAADIFQLPLLTLSCTFYRQQNVNSLGRHHHYHNYQ